MQLLKIYDFRGLWQNGKKMAVPAGYFRRFTNAMKDRTGRIIPFGKGEAKGTNEPVNVPTPSNGWDFPVGSSIFKKGIVQLIGSRIVDTGPLILGFRYSNFENDPQTAMPLYSDIVTAGDFSPQGGTHNDHLPSYNYCTATIFNKTYFNAAVDVSRYRELNPFEQQYEDANLFCFDGLRFRQAGLPLPWNGVESGVGSHYVRTIYATIGMDAEAIFSPILQQQAASAAPTVYLGQYTTLTNFQNTRRADGVGISSEPTFRRQGDSLFNRNKFYDTRYCLISNLTVSGGTVQASRTGCSADLKVGDWLMGYAGGLGGFPGLESGLFMLKIRTLGVSGGTITFETGCKVFDAFSVSWIDKSFTNLWNGWAADVRLQFTGIMDQYRALSNIFQIICYSTTADGNYRISAIKPCCHFSTLSYVPTSLANFEPINVPFMGVVTTFLNDWYQVSSNKAQFPPMLGITGYKELLVGHDRNGIYFSDTSLGGSTEITNGVAFFAPFGSEFGDLTAVCGAEDFLFFSRERKNYVLRGDLATGAVSVTECDAAIAGAYNTRCCANVFGGKIVFMNRDGIWAVDASANVTELSEPIRDLFLGNSPDGNLFDPSVFRTPEQLKETVIVSPGATPPTIDDPLITRPPQDGGMFKVALDADRGFILFFTARKQRTVTSWDIFATVNVDFAVQPNILVYDTNDGSWYEFQGNNATSVESYLSKIFSLGPSFFSEDGVLRGSEKQTILTQWNSAGEPSLEKQVNQVKLFGEFIQDVTGRLGCVVGQQNDWKRYSGSPVLNTSATYTVTDAQQYNHKKRLNSSKPQVTSILFESLPGGGMKLEGMEIEGDLLQEGTKR